MKKIAANSTNILVLPNKMATRRCITIHIDGTSTTTLVPEHKYRKFASTQLGIPEWEFEHLMLPQDLVMCVDENGQEKQLPLNKIATMSYGRPILGTVVISRELPPLLTNLLHNPHRK